MRVVLLRGAGGTGAEGAESAPVPGPGCGFDLARPVPGLV